MVFSKNVSARSREELMALWSNDSLVQYEKYLGLFSMIH